MEKLNYVEFKQLHLLMNLNNNQFKIALRAKGTGAEANSYKERELIVKEEPNGKVLMKSDNIVDGICSLDFGYIILKNLGFDVIEQYELSTKIKLDADTVIKWIDLVNTKEVQDLLFNAAYFNATETFNLTKLETILNKLGKLFIVPMMRNYSAMVEEQENVGTNALQSAILGSLSVVKDPITEHYQLAIREKGSDASDNAYAERELKVVNKTDGEVLIIDKPVANQESITCNLGGVLLGKIDTTPRTLSPQIKIPAKTILSWISVIENEETQELLCNLENCEEEGELYQLDYLNTMLMGQLFQPLLCDYSNMVETLANAQESTSGRGNL